MPCISKKFLFWAFLMLFACKETNLRIINSFGFAVRFEDLEKTQFKKQLKKPLFFSILPKRTTWGTEFYFQVSHLEGEGLFIFEKDTLQEGEKYYIQWDAKRGNHEALKNKRLSYIPYKAGKTILKFDFGDNLDNEHPISQTLELKVALSDFTQEVSAYSHLAIGTASPISWTTESDNPAAIKGRFKILRGRGFFYNSENKNLKEDAFFDFRKMLHSGIMYVPEALGTHEVRFTVRNFDGNLLSRTLKFEVKNFDFTISSAKSMKVNAKEPFKIILKKITKEKIKWIQFQKGAGNFLIYDFQEKPLPLNRELSGIVSEVMRFSVKLLTETTHAIKISICDKNGHVVQKTLSLNALSDDFRIGSNFTRESLYIDETKPLIFTITDNIYKGNYTYFYQFLDGSQHLEIKNKGVVLLPNKEKKTALNEKQISFSLKGKKKGDAKLRFTLKNETGKTKTQDVHLEVQNKIFTFQPKIITPLPHYVLEQVTFQAGLPDASKTDLTFHLNLLSSHAGSFLYKGRKYTSGQTLENYDPLENIQYIGTQKTQHTLTLEAVANNGERQKKFLTLNLKYVDYDVSAVLKNNNDLYPVTFFDMDLEVRQPKSIRVPTTYQIKYALLKGNAIVKNENQNLNPHIWTPINHYKKTLQIQAHHSGDLTMKFFFKNNTGKEKTLVKNLRIQKTDFALRCPLSKNTAPVNEQIPLPLRITKGAGKNLNFRLRFLTDTSGAFIHNNILYQTGSSLSNLTEGSLNNLFYKGTESGNHNITLQVIANNGIAHQIQIPLQFHQKALDFTIGSNTSLTFPNVPVNITIRPTKTPIRNTWIQYENIGDNSLILKDKKNQKIAPNTFYKLTEAGVDWVFKTSHMGFYRIKYTLKNDTGKQRNITQSYEIQKTKITRFLAMHLENSTVLIHKKTPFDLQIFRTPQNNEPLQYQILLNTNKTGAFYYQGKASASGHPIAISGNQALKIFYKGTEIGNHNITGKVIASNGVEKTLTPFSISYKNIPFEIVQNKQDGSQENINALSGMHFQARINENKTFDFAVLEQTDKAVAYHFQYEIIKGNIAVFSHTGFPLQPNMEYAITKTFGIFKKTISLVSGNLGENILKITIKNETGVLKSFFVTLHIRKDDFSISLQKPSFRGAYVHIPVPLVLHFKKPVANPQLSYLLALSGIAGDYWKIHNQNYPHNAQLPLNIAGATSKNIALYYIATSLGTKHIKIAVRSSQGVEKIAILNNISFTKKAIQGVDFSGFAHTFIWKGGNSYLEISAQNGNFPANTSVKYEFLKEKSGINYQLAKIHDAPNGNPIPENTWQLLNSNENILTWHFINSNAGKYLCKITFKNRTLQEKVHFAKITIKTKTFTDFSISKPAFSEDPSGRYVVSLADLKNGITQNLGIAGANPPNQHLQYKYRSLGVPTGITITGISENWSNQKTPKIQLNPAVYYANLGARNVEHYIPETFSFTYFIKNEHGKEKQKTFRYVLNPPRFAVEKQAPNFDKIHALKNVKTKIKVRIKNRGGNTAQGNDRNFKVFFNGNPIESERKGDFLIIDWMPPNDIPKDNLIFKILDKKHKFYKEIRYIPDIQNIRYDLDFKFVRSETDLREISGAGISDVFYGEKKFILVTPKMEIGIVENIPFKKMNIVNGFSEQEAKIQALSGKNFLITLKSEDAAKFTTNYAMKNLKVTLGPEDLIIPLRMRQNEFTVGGILEWEGGRKGAYEGLELKPKLKIDLKAIAGTGAKALVGLALKGNPSQTSSTSPKYFYFDNTKTQPINETDHSKNNLKTQGTFIYLRDNAGFMNKKGIYTLTYQLKNESGFVATFNETIEIKEAEFQYKITTTRTAGTGSNLTITAKVKYKILGKYPYDTNNNVKFLQAWINDSYISNTVPVGNSLTESSTSPDAQGFTIFKKDNISFTTTSSSQQYPNFILQYQDRAGTTQTIKINLPKNPPIMMNEEYTIKQN